MLSREPSSFWPPSPSRNSPASRRLTRLPPPQELDRSNDGQDHTVLPYARPAISPRFSRPCRRSRKPAGETNLTAPFVRTKPWGSRRAIRPAHAFRTRTLPRPPQARLANVTTTRSPLKDEPGWATHTPFPNFGKGEYFRGEGLTGEGRFARRAGLPLPLEQGIGRFPQRSNHRGSATVGSGCMFLFCSYD